MKNIKILLAFVLSLGLTGCYTQIAKDDPYAEEYKVVKEQNDYAQNETEYDTVYVDEDEPSADTDIYYINNYYYDDFDIYRHYFTGYTPCFYCDPFFYAPVVLVGGWYYYYPNVYYAPGYYYPYPPYYYGSPYKVRRRYYHAGLRNNFGRYSLTRTRRHSRATRRYGTTVARNDVRRAGVSDSRKGKQVNLDDLIVGRNGGGKKKGSGKSGAVSAVKIGGKEVAAGTGKNKSKYRTSPPVREPKPVKKSGDAISVQAKKKHKNYELHPPVKQQTTGKKQSVKKNAKSSKKKVLIYKKRNSQNSRNNYRPASGRRSSGHSTYRSGGRSSSGKTRSGSSSGRSGNRGYSSPSHGRSHGYTAPRSSGGSSRGGTTRRGGSSSRSRSTNSRRGR